MIPIPILDNPIPVVTPEVTSADAEDAGPPLSENVILDPTIDTTVPALPESAQFPLPEDDSIFELLEDPVPKRRKVTQSEANLSPRPITPSFRPVLRAKKKNITTKDSAIEDFNVAVGLARGVILPRDLVMNEALTDDEVSRQAIQHMVLVSLISLIPYFKLLVKKSF